MSICYQRNDEICRITFSVNKSRKRLIVCRPKHEFLKRPIRHLQFNWNYYLGHSSLVNYLAQVINGIKLSHSILLHISFGIDQLSRAVSRPSKEFIFFIWVPSLNWHQLSQKKSWNFEKKVLWKIWKHTMIFCFLPNEKCNKIGWNRFFFHIYHSG